MDVISQNFILATAGHVDHGKSALIKALTGSDPDRLPEEKARGITIDLGFASLELQGPQQSAGASDAASHLYRIGIVDVPGHEDFVKNMVAGVGSIDAALFIVAADDGWMPQSEEHLQILSYLGVKKAVVALTKADLLGSDANRTAAISRVSDEIQDSPFAGSPVVCTSVVDQTGIEEIKKALLEVLSQASTSRDFGKPRLPVDRVFTLRGIGTVVTGTLTGGILRRGEAVIVQPSGQKTRIRTLQSHNSEVEHSTPGTRTALNLPDIASHIAAGSKGISRGDTVTVPNLGSPSQTFDVLLEKSNRLIDSKHGAARPIKDGAIVKIHHGSGNVAARISLAGSGKLGPGEKAIAQLRCDSPIFAFIGDHFIVRNWSEEWTLAGGIILDLDTKRAGFRNPSRQRNLEARAQFPNSATKLVAAELQREGAARRSGILTKSRFSSDEVKDAVAELAKSGEAVTSTEWIIDSSRWKDIRNRAEEAVDDEHRQRPQNTGLQITDLRRTLTKELPAPELFDVLVADLCRDGFVQAGTTIRRTSHKPALPPELLAAGSKLRTLLSSKPSEPPSRKELAPDKMSQQALRFLLQTGEAIELSAEVVLLADAFAQATTNIKQHIRENGPATVSELKQAVGASRRIVIPLLERLDRNGITRRDGDKRVLR